MVAGPRQRRVVRIHVRTALLLGGIAVLTLASTANALPTVSISNETAMEADGSMTFTITLSEASATDVHVGFYTKDEEAVSPDDYTAVADGKDIPAGATSTTFDVTIHNDFRIEEAETFTVWLINVSDATWDGTPGVGTITDNPRVSIADAAERESYGVMRFTVTLSHASPEVIHIGFGTNDGSATAPADFTDTSAGKNIPAGQTSTTFDVPIIDDAVDEGDETFTAFLINVAGAGVSDGTAQGTIVDDEREVSILSMSANEAEGVVRLHLVMTSPSALPVLVWTSSEDVTAASPDDYEWGLVPVEIPAGEIGTVLEIPIVDDAKFEEREYFRVHIATFPEATGEGTAVGIIEDNDGSVSIADETADEDAGVMTFTATLSGPAPTWLDITFFTTDGTAVAPGDYTERFHVGQFLLGSTTTTFDVPIVDDLIGEADERFAVRIMNVIGATTIEGIVGPFMVPIADGEATGTILDNEPTLSINDVTGSEAVGEMTFTVTLSRPSSEPIEVTVQTSDETAKAPGDYTRVFTEIEIPPGRTSARFGVPIVDDRLTEPEETFRVLVDAVGARVEDGIGIGTITDNEPTVSVGDASADEGTGSMAFSVFLSHEVATTVQVALHTESGTAAAPEDFVESAGDVEIRPGRTSATFRVPIVDDGIDEPEESFGVRIGSVVGADVADGEAIGTIRDNDGAEIDVQRPAGDPIPDGGRDDVGTVPVGSVQLTYTIDNTAGTGPIDVPFVAFSNRTNLGDIEVTTPLPVHVDAGGTSHLDVLLTTAGDGAFGVDLGIANNDLDENPYDILVRGRSLRAGDVNGDGVIDVLDVRICHAIAAGSRTPTPFEAEQADMDADGDVDMDDAQSLARIVLEID